MSEQAVHQDAAPQKKSSSILLTFFLLVSLLIALGALGFSVYLWQQFQQSHVAQTGAQQRLQQLQQQLTVTDDAVDKQQDAIASQQTTINRLAAETNQRDRTLVLAETEYLTRLANFSLHFEHNVPQAIQLLKTANKRLQSLSDPALMKIREVITDEITNLEAVPNADIPGILLKINALSGEIKKMPLLLTKNTDTDKKPEGKSEDKSKETAKTEEGKAKEAEQPSIWRRGWDKTWSTLKSIVVIRHADSSKIIPPTDRNYIDQHLQLLLAQAQWAVIRHQQKLYTSSIQEAQKWTHQYYKPESKLTQSMLSAMTTLSKVEIQPPVPDLGSSLELIRQTLNEKVGRMKTHSPAST